MSKQTAVRLADISKSYELYHADPSRVRRMFARKKADEFWAIKDINLVIGKGERVGFVGSNGAGKTTLLKVIAGITTPTKGEIITNGKVVSLINLEAGFHPEMTGQENIFLNGLLAGMSKNEITKKFDKIVEFAGIKDFINAAFYTYSSGMKFRLAFSVAVSSECDILLIDEILVSSDINFQTKVISTIKEKQQSDNMTTIVCSHMPGLIWALSDTYYSLEEGIISKLSKKEMFIMVEKREKGRKKNILKKTKEEFGSKT